jgi:hypothetical protein
MVLDKIPIYSIVAFSREYGDRRLMRLIAFSSSSSDELIANDSDDEGGEIVVDKTVDGTMSLYLPTALNEPLLTPNKQSQH